MQQVGRRGGFYEFKGILSLKIFKIFLSSTAAFAILFLAV